MHLFADSGWASGLALVALAGVIGWLLLRTHRHLSRQKQDNSPLVRVSRPQQTEHGHHLDAPPNVLRWEVQMHETARELSAQLDSKMGALQALIAEADLAAARLEAAAGKSPRGVPRGGPPDSSPTTQAEALRPSGESDRAPGEPDLAAGSPPARPPHEQIYALADGGLDPAQIARRLDTPVGEVELILGLRQEQ